MDDMAEVKPSHPRFMKPFLSDLLKSVPLRLEVFQTRLHHILPTVKGDLFHEGRNSDWSSIKMRCHGQPKEKLLRGLHN